MKKLAALLTALVLLTCGLAPAAEFHSGATGYAEAEPAGEPSEGEPSSEPEEEPSGELPDEQEEEPEEEPSNPAGQLPDDSAGGSDGDGSGLPGGGEPEPAPAGGEPKQAPTEGSAGEGQTPVEEGEPEADIVEPENAQGEEESVIEGGDPAAFIPTESGERYGEPDELIRLLLANGGGTLYLLRRVEFTMDDIDAEALALICFSCASEEDQVVYEMEDGVYRFWVEEIGEDGGEDEGSEEGDGEAVIDAQGETNGGAPSLETGFAQPKAELEALLGSLLNGQASQQTGANAPNDPPEQAGEGGEGSASDGGHGAEGGSVVIALEVTPPAGFEQNGSYYDPLTFTLNGKPDDGDYQYAVSNAGGEADLLSENSYTVSAEGAYELRFFIVDMGTGEAVAQSESSYAFDLAAEDAGMGMVAMGFSLRSAPLLGAPTSTPPTLDVSASGNFKDSVWVNTAPTFTLSASRALNEADGEKFGVIIDQATTVPLGSAAPYLYQAAEGQHTLQFVILDNSGVIVTDPAKYQVWMDTTPPSLEALTEESGTLYVTVSDALSGVNMISVDNGKRWYSIDAKSPNAQTDWGYTARRGTRFMPGQIVVKDLAGNSASNPNAFVISMATESGDMESAVTISSSASIGRSGTASRAVAHAEATDHSTTAYNAVELDVETMAMTSLSVGEQSLNLLLYDANQGAAMFTAGLAHWDEQSGVSEAAASGDATADTLVLSAVVADGNAGEYRWEVNGQVFRKLANSGVSYLVLRVGDNVTTLSTAGFTAGLRYDLLKAEGVASKDFHYSIAMSPTPSALSMSLNVAGQTFALSGDENGELYYYNVFSGSPDLLRQAFGAFAAKNQG